MVPQRKPPSTRYRPHVPLGRRKRAKRACIPCRDGKKKCVANSEGPCESCTRTGQACVFEDILKDRNQASVRGLLRSNSVPDTFTPWETLAKDVFTSFDRQLPGHGLRPEQFSVLCNLFKEALHKGNEDLYTDHFIHNEQLPEQSARNSPSGDLTLSTSHSNFLAEVSETIPPHNGASLDPTEQTKAGVGPRNSLSRQEDINLVRDALFYLPLQKEADSLVDVFFTFVVSNWYYFDERWLRDLLSGLYNEKPSTCEQHESATICLVFLVFALGSSFQHLTAPMDSLQSNECTQEVPGRAYYLQARKLIPAAISDNSIESIICCLLTALYVLPTENISQHRIYLSLALNIAVGHSLHRKGENPGATSLEHEVQNRLFWTVYCIERHTAMTMGLPTMLQVKDITSSLPRRRSDLDVDESHSVDRLVAFIELTLVMDKVLASRPVEQNFKCFAWACSTLESWKQAVPSPSFIVQNSSMRATAHLDMMYHMIWLSVGRKSLLGLVRRQLRRSTASDIIDSDSVLRCQELSERCAKAAKTIIEWITLLYSRNLLARFSFTDFHSCSSGVIILLLHAFLHPEDDWEPPVTRGIQALHFMAHGSQLANDAHRLAQQLLFMVKNYIKAPRGSKAEQQTAIATPNGLVAPQGGLTTLTMEQTIHQDTGLTSATPHTEPFADLEPSLLAHSEEELALFGFNGFNWIIDLNHSSWDIGSYTNERPH